MRQDFEFLADGLRRGQAAMLCTVLESSGSTPREHGARLVLLENGETCGTVGGGAVEHAAVLEAQQLIRTEQTVIRHYDLSARDAAGLGMVCGGQMTIFLQYIAGADESWLRILDDISRAQETDTPVWLMTEIDADGANRSCLIRAEEPACPAAVRSDPASLSDHLTNKPAYLPGEPAIFIEPLHLTGKVYLFGGGHVAQALAPVLEHVDFPVVLYEDRAEFATPELFPDAVQRLVAPFTEWSQLLTINDRDSIVIMTRGHLSDYEVLEQALETPAAYIGMIGSRNKIATTLKRLREAGFDEAQIARLHAPIGLDIKSETPAEIAISIVAEMIQHRAQRRAQGLS